MRGLLVVMLMVLGRVASAQVSCPWLTVGTAEKVLGTDMNTEVKMKGPEKVEEGHCVFRTSVGVLDLVVSSEPQKDCPADSAKVAGVGNEARFCQSAAPGKASRFSVDGRVRTMYFRTTLTAEMTADGGRKRVELIAEMVAGNLF